MWSLLLFLFARQEIFPLDPYTETYHQFIYYLQETMLESFTFSENACRHLTWLKEMVADIDLASPLNKMYAVENVDSLVMAWSDLCEGKVVLYTFIDLCLGNMMFCYNYILT